MNSWAIGAVVAGALGLVCEPVLAQSPLPPDNAGAQQYIEPVPDAGGDRPAAGGPHRPARGLPDKTGEALEQSQEGRLLRRIASDPGAGAPADLNSRRGEPSRREEEPASAASGALSALVDSESPGTAMVLLAVIGIALAGAALRRRRAS